MACGYVAPLDTCAHFPGHPLRLGTSLVLGLRSQPLSAARFIVTTSPISITSTITLPLSTSVLRSVPSVPEVWRLKSTLTPYLSVNALSRGVMAGGGTAVYQVSVPSAFAALTSVASGSLVAWADVGELVLAAGVVPPHAASATATPLLMPSLRACRRVNDRGRSERRSTVCPSIQISRATSSRRSTLPMESACPSYVASRPLCRSVPDTSSSCQRVCMCDHERGCS